MSDSEGQVALLNAEQVGYKQSLGRRQVQMIAIGGAIGTGLFLGSASRLHDIGPALFLSYAVTGLVAYFLMRAVGELVLHRTTSGGFVSYMREFFGEKWAFLTGWIYWLGWAFGGITELSAIGIYVQHWWPHMPKWLTVLITILVVMTVNLISASMFAEFEFWASILKVSAIVCFLAVAVVFVVGGVHVGSHVAEISNLWRNPGGFWPTSGGHVWYGPVLAMSGVLFAYSAIELVGMAAGEMKDADREVPRAVKGVIFRIGVFYIGSIFFMAALLPTDEYEAGTSPFVTVFGRMGFAWIADVIQAILIVAALSSLNSGLFATGRILRSLGMSKQAPAFTVKMSTSGVPWAGILMTCIVYGFGVYLNAISPNAFETALEMGALTVIYVWITIFACQLRLRWLANRGVVPMSKFRMPGYPYTGIISIAFLLLVAVGLAYSGWLSSPSFWHKSDFIVVVIGLPVAAAVLGAAWLLVRAKVAAQTGGSLGSVWSVPPENPKQARES